MTGIALRDVAPEHIVDYPRPPVGAPNVVMVVLDDLGFAQLGCYGSSIATPRIDALAEGGLRLRAFHVTSICTSTRASLLTGRNHHAVGMGLTQETPLAYPGYHGRLPASAATLPRILKDHGYSTMAVGKWHLAPRGELSASGPMDRWPLGLGFERYYGFLGAETSQWAPELVRDNSHIDPPATPEEGYHLTEDLVEQAMAMIVDQQQATPGKPFFCYLAPGAVHAPHQVSREWIERYHGAFDDGWEAERERAYRRQVASGLVPADTQLVARPSWIPDWATLSEDERRLYARYMEVFAGFATHTDHQIGRLVDLLAERSLLDDTLLLVLSDNGASGEGTITGTLNEMKAVQGGGQPFDEAMARLDELGGPATYNHYPWGWAWAGNAPFKLWKRYTWLGGTRVPFVAHWPEGLAERGGVRSQFAHAVDVTPTILDAVGVEAPARVDGVDQQRIDGRSMLGLLRDQGASDVRDTQYFEMHGSRSIYHRGWKATTDYVGEIFGERAHIPGSHDHATDHWALFDLTRDVAEATDVAEEHPEVVRHLERLWFAEAAANGVLPLFEGYLSILAAEHPTEFDPPRRVSYRPGASPVVGTQLPSLLHGFRLTARLTVEESPREPQGVLATLGDNNDGFALYVLEGVPVFSFNLVNYDVRLSGDTALRPGAHELEVVYERLPRERRGEGHVAELRLVVDGKVVGTTPYDAMMLFPTTWTAGVGLLVGRDRGLAVRREDYAPPFPFDHTLHEVVVESLGSGRAPSLRERWEQATALD